MLEVSEICRWNLSTTLSVIISIQLILYSVQCFQKDKKVPFFTLQLILYSDRYFWKIRTLIFLLYFNLFTCLQCSDAVGWAAERAPGLYKTKWWGAGMVICLEQEADLHMAQLMPMPLTVSCFSKIQMVLPFWYQLTWVVPDKAIKRACTYVKNLLTSYSESSASTNFTAADELWLWSSQLKRGSWSLITAKLSFNKSSAICTNHTHKWLEQW